MNFKQFLLLQEAGDTRANNLQIESNGSFTRIYFQMEEQLYAVQIKLINLLNTEIADELQSFSKYKIVSIVFGDVDSENKDINFKQVKQKNPASGLKILMAVKNIIVDYIKEHKIDLVVFAAKNLDTSLEKRAKVYTTLATSTSKLMNFWLNSFSNTSGKYFICGNNDTVKMTQQQLKAFEKEILRSKGIKK